MPAGIGYPVGQLSAQARGAGAASGIPQPAMPHQLKELSLEDIVAMLSGGGGKATPEMLVQLLALLSGGQEQVPMGQPEASDSPLEQAFMAQ